MVEVTKMINSHLVATTLNNENIYLEYDWNSDNNYHYIITNIKKCAPQIRDDDESFCLVIDTDVELLKSLDPIVQEGKPFGGLDSSSGWFTSGLGMGGPRHSKIFNLIRLDYCCSTAVDKFGKIRYNTNVSHEISIMSRLGIKRGSNEIQEVGGMVLYPKEYFCPIDFITNKINITDNTYSIHHYTCTWMPKEMIDDLIKRYPELKERYSNN